MKKLMNVEEIINFIENMPFNKAYAAIAQSYEERVEGEVGEPRGEGWWSIIKLKYADAQTLIFDYFGGGYPVAYCIDGVQGEDTVSRAVTDLLENNTSFYGADDVYLIDTELVEIGNS